MLARAECQHKFSAIVACEYRRVTVLEPGGMKTDWINSMVVGPVSEPYRATVQPQVDLRARLSKG